MAHRSQSNHSHLIGRLWKPSLAFLIGLVLVGIPFFAPVFAVPNMVAQKIDILTIDIDADNVADPGDTIRYSVWVTNTGTTDALSVLFDDTIDDNTTLVAGSLRTTPIARHDSYASIGNVGITVPAGSGVLANDNDPDGTGGVSVVSIWACADTTAPFDCSSVNGGDVSLAADGSFSYDPPPGFEGVDQFSYMIHDGDGNQDPAIVFIVVTDMIWFLDNSALTQGDGRLGSPFNSLGGVGGYNAAAADDPGDNIFLYSGSGAYTGGIVLLNSQRLIGQGATASIATISSITLPPFSNALPATGGGKPTITNSGGDGIALAANNLVRGLTAGNASGSSIAGTIGGGTLTVLETIINNSTGGGIEVVNGILAVSLESLTTSSSGDEGIDLTSVAGYFTVPAGSINNSSSRAVNIDGNPSLALTVALTSISSSSTANGILVRDTTGSFTVTGSGTTDGSGGTISSITTRGASFINSTNIALSNMTFSNASTANGASNCTSLVNSGCNAAIHLESSVNVDLTNVDISTSAQQGINGLNVTNFNLMDSTITACGDEVNEGCLRMRNLGGTALISNSNLSFAAERVAQIENTSKTLNLTVSNSTFRDTQSSGFGADGLEVTHNGASNATIDIVNSNFLRNRTNGLQVFSEGTSFVSLDVTGSTFDRGTGIGIGMDLAADNTATLHFNVIGNPLINSRGSNAVNIFSDGSAVVQGRVNDNPDIQVGGCDATTCTSGTGIRAQANDDSGMTLEIDNNTISNIGFDAGIQVISRLAGNSRLDATINNNDVTVTSTSHPSGGSLYDIWVQAGSSQAGENNTTCANVTNNTTSGNGIVAFRVREAGGTVLLQGFNTNATTTWNNNGNTPLNSVSESGTASGGTCNTVSHPTAALDQGQYQVEDLPQSPTLAGLVEGALATLSGQFERLGDELARLDLAALAAQARGSAGEMVASLASGLGVTPAYASGETINQSLGDLNPGQVVRITFDVTVDATIPFNVTQVCNQGLFTSSNHGDVLTDDPAVGGGTDPTCTAVPQADLSIEKSDSADPVTPNAAFSYTVTVVNNGPSVAQTVVVTDTLPVGVTYVSDDCGAGSPVGQVWTWNIGTLANAGSAVCNINVTAPGSAGTVTNNAGVSTTTHDPFAVNSSASEDTTVQQPGTIIINKTTTPAGGTGFGFTDDIASPNSFSLNDGQSKTFLNVLPGSYTVTENDPTPAFDLTALLCVDPDGGSSLNLGERSVSIDLDAGETVSCYFTNTKRGTILVQKAVSQGDPSNPNQTFTLDIRLGSEILGGLSTIQAGDPPVGLGNLLPATYTVNEINLAAGWTLDDITCVNNVGSSTFGTFTPGDNSLEVTLAPGSVVLCTFTNVFNFPPVANNDSYSTNEDTALNITAPGVLANDTDADGDTLTAVKDSDPSHGTLTLNSDGSFSYQPDENYCDDTNPDSFNYHANDGQADSNVATVYITVECVDDPPGVSVDVTSQTVQYSDIITDVTVTATDVDSHPLSISDNAPSNLSISGSCTPDGGGTSCSWTLSGQVLVTAGTYNVTFTVSDASNDVDAGTEIVVTEEDADVSFDSDNPVAVPVSSPGDSSEPFSLLVHVQESSESGSGVLPGNINQAVVSMTLEPVGPGSPVTVTCTSTGAVTAFDYNAVLEVTCDFSGVPVNTYTANATIGGGYYTGAAEDVLVVYDPSLGFTTGGGWFYWPGTEDGDYRGDRTNFGYNMKYNKRGTNIQGNLLLIRHLPDGSIYRLKSNVINGLALKDEGTYGWASFSGKATYLEPGWPEPVGNHTFLVYVEDHGEPGAGVDLFWIEVKDKDGNLVTLSMSPPAATNAKTLEGGNIVVPHGKGGGKGKNK